LRKIYGHGGIVLAVFFLLVGCAVSEEEALELGRQAYIESIEIEALEPNIEKDGIRFHLPRGFEIEKEIEYNILLNHNDQLFNLLYQPYEPQTSTFHLERDLESAGTALIYEVNETDEEISYLIVNEEGEEGQYHVITAVGGARITTVTSYPLLENSIKEMTSIVQSYEVIQKS
jgi:hypothetical protein